MSTPTTKLKRHGDTMRGALNWSGTDFAGLTIQTLTTTQRDALSPSNGTVVYNSTDGKFQGYQSGSWVTLASEAFVTAAEGSDWKQSCQLATTANITLSGEQSIDGVTTSSSRVLVKDQSTGSENGIYVSASGAWTRATDADADADVTSGLTTYIEEGSTLAKTAWQLTTANPIIVGTTALTFEEFDPAGGSAIPQSEPATGNMLVGTGAGSSLSGATFNTFLGQQAGNAHVGQDYDTLVGYRAGGGGITLHSSSHERNVMIGFEAGYDSTGNDNVCLGMQSDFGGTASGPSQNNVIIGRLAGANLVGYQGNQNTLIGASTGPASAGACNATTLIGALCTVNVGVVGGIGINGDVIGSNQCVIGGSTSANYLNNVYLNSAEAATVYGCTLNAGGGSGTDIAGGDLGLAGGKATGSASGGTIFFKTSVADVSGTTLQSLQNRMRIDDEGRVHIGWSGTEVAPSSGYCFQVYANTASAWGAYVYNDLGEGLRVATAASDKAALWASRAGSTADGNYTIRGQSTGIGGDSSTVPIFQAYRSNGGTPAAGFGSSFQFYAHNAAATDHFQGAIDCAWTDATDTSEDSKFEFYTAVASAKTLALTINGTKTQAVSILNSPELEQTLVDGATINWDMDSGGVGIVTLAGNRALAAPTNIKNGARYILHVIQDGTGTRTLSFNAVFKWAGGTAPTLSTGGGDIDVFEFQARGGNLYEVSQKLNLS